MRRRVVVYTTSGTMIVGSFHGYTNEEVEKLHELLIGIGELKYLQVTNSEGKCYVKGSMISHVVIEEGEAAGNET